MIDTSTVERVSFEACADVETICAHLNAATEGMMILSAESAKDAPMLAGIVAGLCANVAMTYDTLVGLAQKVAGSSKDEDK